MEARRGDRLAGRQWVVETGEPDDPEPMAWCLDCDERLQTSGQWTDALLADQRLVCDRCFEPYASGSATI
jgi:hypothetical protein